MSNPSPNKIEQIFAEGTPIDNAIKAAVRQAVLQHALLGFPVAEWRDGRVVWVSPEETLARLRGQK